jgi:uncharacterized membrane-anchored protein YjiN (DUF445 family)
MSVVPLTPAKPLTPANRTERWARLSLVIALGLAVLGKFLEHVPHAAVQFFGGMVAAFGEAALVGGLADWFAVRALFGHPFGIPFPHTAIIPNNRKRIVSEIRTLVQEQWLPPSLLKAKVEAFDFVKDGLMPVLPALKQRLPGVLRAAARDVLTDLSPAQLAGFLGQGAAQAVEANKIGPFLADLAGQARDEGWLEPLWHEWVKKLRDWVEKPESRSTIYGRLAQAADAYRERGWFKNVTVQLAQAFGGLDLSAAADVIQSELKRFADDQLADGSPLQHIVQDGLTTIETRLREEPEFTAKVRSWVLESEEGGTLKLVIEPALASLREQGLRELESPDSKLVAAAAARLNDWLDRLIADPEVRDRVNAWCRKHVAAQIEKHHSLLGVLVEEQLNRLSNENLTEMIEAKVGEDLNWIRLNGAVVGGTVGVLLFLVLKLLTVWLPG